MNANPIELFNVTIAYIDGTSRGTQHTDIIEARAEYNAHTPGETISHHRHHAPSRVNIASPTKIRSVTLSHARSGVTIDYKS